jgi:signal transduction histidine kinase
MLGPLEDALADSDAPLPPAQRGRVDLVLDNALRLLKLVNALLDFSRLEAGRMRASYAPLDVSGFTAELAGMFQSAVVKAGLRLRVECPPLSQPVWVDRDMWETIVPNLVSNAFKFTVAGEIAVRVLEQPDGVVLEVADTGTGIPEAELPRIFERFHRVSGATGRTHEGTGIGLSLVRELVQLHRGRVSVESVVGKGTTFRVEIPKGFGHLPPEMVSAAPADPSKGVMGAAHAAEAARWGGKVEDDARSSAASLPAPALRAHALVVDDNADLRAYVGGLLAPYYEVTTASDGLEALDAVSERMPDIVVSDVMMPRLDGFGLVRELRRNRATASLPVILLSARAGEASAVEGLDAGSDDYLVKPFTARELLARVRTHVELARARRAWVEELERANRELDAFSYSVSHDLRAPLRSIDGFSRALEEDCGDALSEEGKDSLRRIRAGVGRMATLIDDLLKLARITRTRVSRDRVDLTALASGILDDLRRAHPHRDVTVDVAEGLTVEGDPALLRVALVNLLENAWKYSAHRVGARIEFARHAAEEPTFVVRDNGAGFDMAYADRLFAPFQRLHRAEEFEGTGIGLATVQRVIHRHGGRIWAEAEVGRGAAFFFALPVRAAAR